MLRIPLNERRAARLYFSVAGSAQSAVLLAVLAVRVAVPQSLSLPQPQNSPASAQCQVRVVANQVVVTDQERRAAGYQARPAGIIPDPGQWPYFAWPDTQLGVVRTRDGSRYLFFGSDGSCHEGCAGNSPRSGSITVTQGTLDHPLGLPVGDPDPSPTEFLLSTSVNLPATMDYVGGGPVYRVPEGEPGAGNLLLVYHAERPANPFWSWLGLAKSDDDGGTWQDLGLMISPNHPYNANGAIDIGDSSLVVTPGAESSRKYFYVYFGSDTTFLSVARAPYEELLRAVFEHDTGSPTIVSNLFFKYYNGAWDQPGIGGEQSELFPAVTGETDGDPQVAWSAYRQRYIAIMDNGQYIAYGESADGLQWPPMQVLLGTSPQTAVYAYANAIGMGQDPANLGDTFYSFYTEFPQGTSWQPATLNRLTITTAATLKSIAPTVIAADGPGFLLTVNGDHFVPGSVVLWNGSARETTYVSSTRLTAQILFTDVAATGTATVAISNPAPCGGVSNATSFTISVPPPAVTLSATPARVFAGQPFTLTWSSTHALTCAASGGWSGVKTPGGSETITPAAASEPTYTLACDGPGGESQTSLRVQVEAPTLSTTEIFSPNALTIPTSEGSPYGFCNFWTTRPQSCAKQTSYGYGPVRVMQVYICLSGQVSINQCSQQPQVTGPLSPSMLKNMEQRLAAYAGSGMRILLRFTYNFGPIGPESKDAPINLIAEHLDQVAPIVLRHRDLIFALEPGFIGTWGEWHDSTSGNETAAAQRVVLDKERYYFGGRFPILVRDVGQLVQYTGSLTLQPDFGLDDDYYASNSTDASTWSPCATRSGFCLRQYTPAQFEAYGTGVAGQTMFLGEFGALYPALQSCAALDTYSYAYHLQSIGIDSLHITQVPEENCLKSFLNKTGARIVLQRIRLIGTAHRGGRLYLEVTLVNAGYGRVIRQRPTVLVLLQDSLEIGRIEIPMGKMDLRKLESASAPKPATFAFEFRLPRVVHPGPLTVALQIQDPSPTLRPQPAYALPFNSLDKSGRSVFNPHNGLNRLATIGIGSGQP